MSRRYGLLPILHLGLVYPDGTSSSNQEIKSKMTTVQKTVQIIDYADVKVQKKLDETTVDLKEYANFSDNATVAKNYATRDLYIAKAKTPEKAMKMMKLEELKKSKRKKNNGKLKVLENKNHQFSKNYEETMKDAGTKHPDDWKLMVTKKIEWIVCKDICLFIKVLATVVKFSKVSHPEKIADFGLSARTLTSTSL